MRAHDLRCEYLRDPLGIDTLRPRLSWKLSGRGSQAGYQIKVFSSRGSSEPVWDSGFVSSKETSTVFGGPVPVSRQRYTWTVSVVDVEGRAEVSDGSGSWEMGLLDPSEWQAHWIGDGRRSSEPLQPCPYFKKRFSITEPIESARVYVTALGLYRLFVNGTRVGKDLFTPGWTDYHKRLQYQVYDISHLVDEGPNLIGAVLADGWYSGYLGTEGQRQNYGTQPQLLLQMECTHPDGGSTVVVSDGSWQVSVGPHIYSDIYMGESFDASRELKGWSETRELDPEGWRYADETEGTAARLVATTAPAVSELMTVTPIKVSSSRGGHIFDFGQNLVGFVRLRAARGDGRIEVRHAEVLDDQGDLYVDNLRMARATDAYVRSSADDRVFEPWFTFHGFRYAEVSGLDETELASVSAVVVGSAVDETGSFTCSDAGVDRVFQNLHWSQRGVWLEIPMDCPQRDERLGWTGDISSYIGSALYNFDGSAFLTKWLRDVVDAQTAKGSFPDVAPLVQFGTGSPGWGDAGVWVPWMLYLFYGDSRVLEENYEPMQRWIQMIADANPDGLWTREVGGDYGDWLSTADTPKEVMSTAVWSHSTDLLARTARVLGRDEDAAEYRKLHERIRAAFRRDLVDSLGVVKGSTQTGQAMALAWDLIEPELRPLAIEHLAKDVLARGTRLSTGFFGTKLLLHVLADNGHLDLAYDVLLSKAYPGWLYMVEAGATTMWEHWDSWTHEHGFKNPFMNSFNHPSLGSVGSFLFGVVGGIAPDPEEPGFANVLVGPRPLRFEHASCSYLSCRGEVVSKWRRHDGSLRVDVTIPAGSTATIRLPGRVDSLDLHAQGDVVSVDQAGEDALIRTLSGSFRFEL